MQAAAPETSKVATLDQVRRPPEMVGADQKVDMFSARGFDLACRISKAFATSNAVPAQFRSWVEKKVGRETQWVENTSALGNCIVAIEVAQAVGMSITAVMQNADVIEGKLRWSGKFVIAAINASGRFTPLRFQMVNRGMIKATYKEKTGWDKEINRPVFTEHKVEVENYECIAWALPRGTAEPRPTPEQMKTYAGRMLDLYRDLGLPVIESAPVTMRMAVEEGWYGKTGSKWQTEMRNLMFQYRAGSFFGNIHAPDIVMGMGRTSEEERDIVELVRSDDGVFSAPIEALRPQTEPTDQGDAGTADERGGAAPATDSAAAQATSSAEEKAEPKPEEKPATAPAGDPPPTFAFVEEQIRAALSTDALDKIKAGLIPKLATDNEKADAFAEVARRIKELKVKKPPIAAE